MSTPTGVATIDKEAPEIAAPTLPGIPEAHVQPGDVAAINTSCFVFGGIGISSAEELESGPGIVKPKVSTINIVSS